MSYVESVGIPGLFGLTGTKTAYKDENILLGEAQAINFTGAGVAATLNAGVLTVEVEGGGSSINVVDNLSSTSATDALSANQGNALDSRLSSVEGTQSSYGDIVTYNASQFETAGAAADALSNAQDYADDLVVGLLDDRGNYDPTVTSLYPTTGGSGTDGAILKGDLWAVSADGYVNGIAVTVGDTIRALVDSPAQSNANWAVIQNNLIYVPENTTNKAISLSLPNDTKYPTTLAVSTALEDYATVANQRYVFVSDSGTTYTVPAGAVTENGRTIIELSNNSLGNITVNAATGTGKSVGDSVNISITGTYAAQTLAADGVTLNGTLAFSANAKIKTLIYRGTNTWTVLGG